jgi:hypothetical protein
MTEEQASAPASSPKAQRARSRDLTLESAVPIERP